MKDEDYTPIPLTPLQRETNVFTRKMFGAKCTIAYVNEEYIKPIYKTLTCGEFKDGCKLGSVELKINNKIKKYYFE